MDFLVLTGADALIRVSVNENTTRPYFEIVIGGGNNTYSAIRNSNKETLIDVATPGILDPISFTPFWVTYVDGVIQIGKMHEVPFLSYFVGLHNLNAFAFSSWYGRSAQWIVNYAHDHSK